MYLSLSISLSLYIYIYIYICTYIHMRFIPSDKVTKLWRLAKTPSITTYTIL